MALRENLIERFDYLAVPQAVWKYLYAWYSADWCISRRLIKDSVIGSFLDPPQNYPSITEDSNQSYLQDVHFELEADIEN